MKRKILILILAISVAFNLSTRISDSAKVEDFAPKPTIAFPSNYN